MARIARLHRQRAQRPADPYFRGAQDHVIFGERRNPFRPGTPEVERYDLGYCDAFSHRPLTPLPGESLNATSKKRIL